jgi:hypothetical protein
MNAVTLRMLRDIRDGRVAVYVVRSVPVEVAAVDVATGRALPHRLPVPWPDLINAGLLALTGGGPHARLATTADANAALDAQDTFRGMPLDGTRGDTHQ